jgi:hypothetical protein
LSKIKDSFQTLGLVMPYGITPIPSSLQKAKQFAFCLTLRLPTGAKEIENILKNKKAGQFVPLAS